MRFTGTRLAITLGVGLAGFGTWTRAVPAQDTGDQPSVRKVLVNEDDLVELGDESLRYLDRARDRFRVGDSNGAAGALRKAAVFMSLEASRATRGCKECILSSVREIRALADKAEKGTNPVSAEVGDAITRTHLALAMHHCEKSVHCLHCRYAADVEFSRSIVHAGRDLRAAADHLERGAQRAGKKLADEDAAALKIARGLAEEMIRGVPVSVEASEGVFESLNQRIRSFGKRKIGVAPWPEESPNLPSITR